MVADNGFYFPGTDPDSQTSHLESLRRWWRGIGYLVFASLVFILGASFGAPLPSPLMESLPFYMLYLLVVLIPVHIVLGGWFAERLWKANRCVTGELVFLIGSGLIELIIFLVYVFPLVHLLVFERPV